MKKFLLFTTCISALSISFGSDAFSWSENEAVLKEKVAAIKEEAIRIPFCFYDQETEIMNALDEAMKVKDPDDAYSKLASIYCDLTSRGDSARVLSKEEKTTKQRTSRVEENHVAIPVSWAPVLLPHSIYCNSVSVLQPCEIIPALCCCVSV